MKNFKEAKEGDKLELPCFVKEIKEKETKTGKKFVVCTLVDKDKTEVQAKKWQTTKEEMAGVKLIYASLSVDKFNDKLNFIIDFYREAVPDEADIMEFIKSAPLNANDMYQSIVSFVKSFKDQNLSNLVCTVYTDFEESLKFWTAAKSVHHNIIGGLLYHNYRMLQAAVQISKAYKIEDAEILYAGVLLHDIGKLEELNVSKDGITEYSKKGMLLGHSLIGCQIVKDYCLSLSIDDEIMLRLEHMIASHHGKLEWGAIVLPQTEEAFLLHQIDMLDSRVYQFEEIYEKTPPGTSSEKVFSFDNQQIYHPL